MSAGPRSVLFVCLGNICRSPAAEAIFAKVVRDHGIEAQITTDSAGTAGYHIGKLADARMREAAAQRGYTLTSRARQIERGDLGRHALIVAMDRDNYSAIQCLAPGHAQHVKMLSDFLDDSWPRNVPDPYYGGPEGFVYVIEMLEAACPRIIEYLCSEVPGLQNPAGA